MKRIFLHLCFIIIATSTFAQNTLHIDRQRQRIVVLSQHGDSLLNLPCAMVPQCGQSAPDSIDRLTDWPFKVASVKKAKSWVHGDKTKQGTMEGAYKTWVITLKSKERPLVEIHGTYNNESFAKHSATGCILVRNAEMEQLAQLVSKKSGAVFTADTVPPVEVVTVVDTVPRILTEDERLDSILAARQTAIVDTSIQLYGYERMMLDIRLLCRKFPDIIRYEMRDTTYQGRVIPVVFFGGQQPAKRIMVQAAMHAREYITTPLILAMLEHYASNYKTGSYNGQTYAETFDSVALTIVPMANPDGVEISQRGVEGCTTDDVREWVQSKMNAGISHTQIKANARGVDVNRNFTVGFGAKREAKGMKDFYYYEGEKPYSEVESRLLMAVAKAYDHALFLNYHTRGNIIYWGALGADKEVNRQAERIAKMVQRHTGYPPYGPKSQKPCGSWGDEVELVLHRPNVTIEVGTVNPVPISQMQTIFRKNINVWADLCQRLLKGGF